MQRFHWLAWVAATSLLACGDPERGSPPNVVVVVVDTLRSDHLGLYGYERETSPAIDRLGREGWTFENHVSAASQTVPATLTLLLSRYPVDHGFVHRKHGQFRDEPPLYPDELLFLSEVFQRAGYATAAFVTNPFLGEPNGFRQGFDHFHYRANGRGRRLTNDVEKWLREATRAKPPFFLYVHYMDVHGPYQPPRSYARRFATPGAGALIDTYGPLEATAEDLDYTIAMYDACIALVDDQIERIVDALDAANDRDETVVVVTSDHGDEFGEHGGFGHGTTVFGELVRIPLVISYRPALRPGRRVAHLTRQMDLAPTLLALAGLDAPPAFQGQSLFERAEVAIAENGPWRAVYSRGRNLVLNRETGDGALFDASDVFDQTPLADPESEARLGGILDRYLELEDAGGTERGPRGQAPAWTDEQLELLRRLGYVE